jgi:hypothetical protein
VPAGCTSYRAGRLLPRQCLPAQRGCGRRRRWSQSCNDVAAATWIAPPHAVTRLRLPFRHNRKQLLRRCPVHADGSAESPQSAGGPAFRDPIHFRRIEPPWLSGRKQGGRSGKRDAAPCQRPAAGPVAGHWEPGCHVACVVRIESDVVQTLRSARARRHQAQTVQPSNDTPDDPVWRVPTSRKSVAGAEALGSMRSTLNVRRLSAMKALMPRALGGRWRQFSEQRTSEFGQFPGSKDGRHAEHSRVRVPPSRRRGRAGCVPARPESRRQASASSSNGFVTDCASGARSRSNSSYLPLSYRVNSRRATSGSSRCRVYPF